MGCSIPPSSGRTPFWPENTGCSSAYGVAGWDVCSVPMTIPGPLSVSVAFGASMPCGAGTSNVSGDATAAGKSYAPVPDS